MTDRSEGALVTVGVPVYNGAAHLREALQSIQAQTHRALEVIISDNASGDETPAIGRAFAERDDRFIYYRNQENIGFLPNFRRVLDIAQGKYFTWLAHDDLLSDDTYLQKTVEYLQAHPNVALCATGFELLNSQLSGARTVDLENLYPEHVEARRSLFRWPHGWVDMAVYGMFRLDALRKIELPDGLLRGQPHIFWWETSVLTALARYGDVVALPDRLRSYRMSTGSVGMHITRGVSPLDLFLLGLRTKAKLVRYGQKVPTTKRERLGLLGTTIANFFRGNLRNPYAHRHVMHLREQTLRTLIQAAEERARLIANLHSEVIARREILKTQSANLSFPRELNARLAAIEGTLAAPLKTLSESGSRGTLKDFLSPPTEWQIERGVDLHEHLGTLHALCAEQLTEIETLHAEAARLLALISPADTTAGTDEPPAEIAQE